MPAVSSPFLSPELSRHTCWAIGSQFLAPEWVPPVKAPHGPAFLSPAGARHFLGMRISRCEILIPGIPRLQPGKQISAKIRITRREILIPRVLGGGQLSARPAWQASLARAGIRTESRAWSLRRRGMRSPAFPPLHPSACEGGTWMSVRSLRNRGIGIEAHRESPASQRRSGFPDRSSQGGLPIPRKCWE